MENGADKSPVWQPREEEKDVEAGDGARCTAMLPNQERTGVASEGSPHQARTAVRSSEEGPWRRRFDWRVEEYSVKTRKGTRTVLQHIVGRAESGDYVGILGPSGSGKTSLLDCLSLRTQAFRGGVTVDGHAPTDRFFVETGYVPQEEAFFSHLTAREHLSFHCINRMLGQHGYRTTAACLQRVEQVLAQVDLLRVADTFIGGGVFFISRGLSGGERKRLNIATELISDPSILFLDEPTSGLDAVMGELVSLLLRGLASKGPRRLLVVSAMHTPSSKMFGLFTHLLILTSLGRLAYFGPRDQLLPFLSGLGFDCPANYNPADFVLELASAKVLKASASEEDQSLVAAVSTHLLTDSSTHQVLVEACSRTLVSGLCDDPSFAPDHHRSTAFRSVGARSSLWTQCRTNVWRAWIQMSRDRIRFTVSATTNAILGLIIGLLFLGKVEGSFRNTGGLLYALSVTILISASIAIALHTPSDFRIVLREYLSGANSAVPYFLGRTLAGVVFSVDLLALALLSYVVSGLSLQPSALAWYCVIISLLIFGAQSVGYISSSFSSNPVVGLALLPVLVTPMVLFSGLLYDRTTVSPWLRWIQDTSLVNYTYTALVLNQCRQVGPPVSTYLLTFLRIDAGDFYPSLRSLTLLAVGFRLLAFLVIMARFRTARPT